MLHLDYHLTFGSLEVNVQFILTNEIRATNLTSYITRGHSFHKPISHRK